MPNIAIITAKIHSVVTERVTHVRLVLCPKHRQELQDAVISEAGITADNCYFCDQEWYTAFRAKIQAQTWLNKVTTTDTVYIAGPMSGIEGYNRPAFWMMEHILKQTGCQILSPAHYDDGHAYGWYMKRGVKMVCDATALVMLKEWEKSMGATTEYQIALLMNLPIYNEL